MTLPRACVLLLVCLNVLNEAVGGCILSLKRDFPKTSVVYLRHGRLLSPDAVTGDVQLRRSETLQVACPGEQKYIVLSNKTTNHSLLDVKCVSDSLFRASRLSWIGNFSEIRCNAPPWTSADEVGGCGAGAKNYRIGYKVSGHLHGLYEACFNKDLLSTLYVKQELGPESVYIQSGGRPNFVEQDFFGKVKMSKLYHLTNQKARFKQVLGEGKEEEYLTKKQYLTRGHLSPRADHSLLCSQRASFLYLNTAPQWRRGNAGDWAALEEALRRRVHSYGRPVTVYTGTFGVSTLGDTSSRQQQLYLSVDQNNNGILPVPLYYYKVVFDAANNTAAAFVSINSSYYNQTMIEKLTFCEDICGSRNYSWLRWRSSDGTHSFCCEYHDFVKTVHDLPGLKVEGLFY
ncbi:uncharacterized protein LOC116776949 isoform X1 [Danaus plexippus]|uniref:uncharacterized protein LOC116776949 isoform X1 n=1 Tax=Danaus plexippus TaxID=13037 RepID=UPI002AB26E1A|nr:uncharacterized protein LOC116776949 isoform X1 [Danaus plexippus]